MTTHALDRIQQAAPADVKNSRHEALDKDKRIATRDDTMAGMMLATEIMGTAMAQGNMWRNFAMRCIALTHEAREAFLNAIKKEKAALTKGQVEFGIGKKIAQQRTNSFATQISELRTIALAWNEGATITGWREYVNTTVPEDKRINTDEEIVAHGGYRTLVEYARTVAGKKKPGRPAKSWLDKVAKFLDDNVPDGEDLAAQSVYQQMVAVYNAAVADKK